MTPAVSDVRTPLYRYRLGSAEVDESLLELRIGGLLVDVEQKPLRVLIELLHHAGEVVSRDELLESVWSGRITTPQVLTNAITKLRKALGDTKGEHIVTVPGVGYRLVGEVERVAIGRRLLSALELKAGEAVPGREHFVLESQIGASLGSEVWLARHRKSREPLVYKFSADGSRLRALKREATLYRVLRESLGEREDFVRIIDWNFETPPFYLECEYCGENLAQWAETDDRLKTMSTEERLALFLQIADAVAAAHGVGVLHRDLKPTNVLVAPGAGGGWQVRVGDFGSGRLLESGALEELGITQLGLSLTQNVSGDSRSGTPLYLAPELIAGQSPTVRSDIYALGLILYQMLIGNLKQPMAPGWESGVGNELLCEDIAAATNGDPSRRLGSVIALTESLRRQKERAEERRRLQDTERRMLQAERKLQRSQARQPWIIALVAVLVAGMLTSLLLYRESQQKGIEAARQAAIAGSINNFLQSMLAQANPNEAGSQDLTVHQAIARIEDQIDSRFAGNPELAASIYLAVGETEFHLGNLSRAETQLREALDLLATSGSADPIQIQKARYQLALTLAYDSKFNEAETLLSQADKVYDASKAPADLAAAANYTHGMLLLQHVERTAEAVPYFEKAIEAQRLADAHNKGMIVEIQAKLAHALVFAEQYQKAEALLKSMLSQYDASDHTTALRLSLARETYGEMLTFQGRYAEAEPVLRQAHDELVKGMGGDNYRATKSLADLAALYATTGQWQRAEETYNKVYSLLSSEVGKDSALTTTMLGWQGAVEYEAGDTTEAIDKLERSRTMLSTKYPDFGTSYIHCFGYYLAAAYAQRGFLDQAQALLDSVNADAAIPSCGDDPFSARLEALRGVILLKRGDREQATQLLRSALGSLTAHHAPDYLVAKVQSDLDSALASSVHRAAGSKIAYQKRSTD